MSEQIKTAKKFWKAWQKKSEQLNALELADFIEQSNAILHKYFAEISLDSQQTLNKKQWVVTAHGAVVHFADVVAVQATAPDEVKVGAFRQPLPTNRVADFEITTSTGVTLSASDLTVAVSPMSHLIRLQVAPTRPLNVADIEVLQDLTLLILEAVLGEWDFAVKIHTLDFVNLVRGEALALSELSSRVQAVWVNELGHTGEYEDEPEYLMAQTEQTPDQPHVIITVDKTANSLLGRQDFGWCICLQTRLIDADGIEIGSDFDEILRANLSFENGCVPALTVLDLATGVRYMYIYCQDPVWAEKQLNKMLPKFPKLEHEYVIDYDPSWHWYRI